VRPLITTCAMLAALSGGFLVGVLLAARTL